MLLPIGFGQWPRAFPLAIILITLTCCVWSVAFFPQIKKLDKEVAEMRNEDRDEFKNTVRDAIFAGCNAHFPGKTACNELKQKSLERMPASEGGSEVPPQGAPAGHKPQHKKGEGLTQVLELLEVSDYVSKFGKRPEDWPEDAKATPEYKVMAENLNRWKAGSAHLAVKHGMTSRSNAGIFNLTRASFTHGNYMHLIGNLIFLIAFGVWVEQRAGFMITAMTFLAGSFTGIAIQLLFEPDSFVLGASAGISALMGAFLLFFMRAEFQFVFTFGFVYYRRLWIPLFWVFPFAYMISDLTSVIGRESTGVAHWAHLGGLAVGLVFAWVVNKTLPLPAETFFFEEESPLRALRKTSDRAVLWKSFSELMKWNAQNWRGIQLFLAKAKTMGPANSEDLKLLEKHANGLVDYAFRRGSIDDMLGALKLVPTGVGVEAPLAKAPLSQICYLADVSAQRGDFTLALPLYRMALKRAKDGLHVQVIQGAIREIQALAPNTGLKVVS